MAGGTTPKLRLVRCPKCRLVLPEVANFPVYKCGGCDTILVAKNQKAIAKSTSVLQETEAADADNLFHMSEHGDSSCTTLQEVPPSSPESHSSQESGGNQNISADSHCEKHGVVENSSIEGQHNGHHEKDQNASRDSDGGSDCDKLDENRSNERQKNGSGQMQLESVENCNVKKPGVSNEGSLYTEIHHENEELMLVAEANDKTLQLEGANSELETTDKIDSNTGSSSIDNPQPTRTVLSTEAAQAVTGEVFLSDNLFSSPNKILEQPQKSERDVFDRVRSIDSFETADFASPSSELSGPLENFSKSATIRSSISSFDGTDDRFPDQKIHSFKNSYEDAANYIVPEERDRRDKLPAKSMMYGNSERARNLSSDLSYKKHFAGEKYSMWHQGEPLEPVMHHRLPRNWPKHERDEYSSKISFSQMASLRGYESAGTSRELQDEFPFDSTFYPLEKIEYAEQENMKLLRMLYELQDQISKTHHLNGRASTDIPWRQKYFPTYYYQAPTQDENFYPRYQGRHGKRSYWSQQSRFTSIPFSGGAINTRQNIDNSCLYCHPQDWQRSEQLPPPIFRYNREYCQAHPGHICYESYSSCLSSPRRYSESDFSTWSHEIKYDDQSYRDHELKRYMREKNHSVRRHLRPTAGGAPFVACYYCFRPLQLPADFLLFRRRFHRLRCGACSKVLKFLLQKGLHIVPYELVAAEPPSGEVEYCSDAINARISTLASCDHGVLQASPISYSDDYGHSYSKSCSTNRDPVSHAEFHDPQGNADVKHMFSNSYKRMEQSKDIGLKQSRNKHKISMETFDLAEPFLNTSRSEKVSSEVEELPQRTGGKSLHQLMGYSSPSQLIYGFEPSISGTSSVPSGETSDLDISNVSQGNCI